MESPESVSEDRAGAPEGQGANEEPSEMDFAPSSIQPGDVVTGRVVRVEDDHVLVDVGYKSEGYLPLDELSYRKVAHPSEVVKEGDEVTVLVLRNDGEDGTLRLSKRRAEEREAYDHLVGIFEKGETISVPVVEAVKGGLVVDVGTRGFVPASQVDRGYVEDLSQYVGQELKVKIIELDRQKRRVILSRRQVLEEERSQARNDIWASIEEGQTLSGTVKSLTDFGAFIDLGGVDGLLHVSEMSWGRVQHPSEVLKESEKVQVKVLRLDRERGRISLGLKQVLNNPWEDIERRYPEGSIVKGTVVRLATFGAFVELEPGIDGLIHVSQLAEHHVTRPQDVVSIGDDVRVKVLRVDPEQRRVSLSLKEGGTPSEQRADEPSQAEESPATIGEILHEDLKRDLFQ